MPHSQVDWDTAWLGEEPMQTPRDHSVPKYPVGVVLTLPGEASALGRLGVGV